MLFVDLGTKIKSLFLPVYHLFFLLLFLSMLDANIQGHTHTHTHNVAYVTPRAPDFGCFSQFCLTKFSSGCLLSGLKNKTGLLCQGRKLISTNDTIYIKTLFCHRALSHYCTYGVCRMKKTVTNNADVVSSFHACICWGNFSSLDDANCRSFAVTL